MKRWLALFVHFLTASGAVFGLLALLAIHAHDFLQALWWMFLAVAVDAVDGSLARHFRVRAYWPSIDGALLDNLVDFFNYTLVPGFFLLLAPILPADARLFCVICLTIASAYQFTQVDAKTEDYFFKGFPSYWNIAVFYLFFWQLDGFTNMGILLTLTILSFVPIKYLYPSRLHYLTHRAWIKKSVLLLTVGWGIVTAALLWSYPETHPTLIALSVIYMLFYLSISLYRTWVPFVPMSL